MKTYKPIFFVFFLLRQVFTDDEALTKLFHFSRSLARSITFRISHPLSFMSSSTLSIHFFLGFPLLLNPSTSPSFHAVPLLVFFPYCIIIHYSILNIELFTVTVTSYLLQPHCLTACIM